VLIAPAQEKSVKAGLYRSIVVSDISHLFGRSAKAADLACKDAWIGYLAPP
jgi:hypothetical protein